MDNPGEILRLCRLCLVKDQVNIPIFEEQGDIRQIFLKISSCLPVKVSLEDKLPKRICDGCSNKLDLLYEFWNTSANAEKTLLSWLGQAGVKDADETISAVAQQIAKPAETQVKQEALDEGHASNQVHDSFGVQSFDEEAKDESEAPPPKRARRTAAVKAQINLTPESDEDDDMDSAEAMTKVEDESDESDGEDKDPSYGEIPGTSADDQAGPSGVGKDGVEAPKENDTPDLIFMCSYCFCMVESNQALINHVAVCFLKQENQTDDAKSFVQKNTKLPQELDGTVDISKNDTTRRYSCPECGKFLKTKSGVNDHINKVHKRKYCGTVTCPECPKIVRKSNLRKHIDKMHKGIQNLVECDICGGEYKKDYLQAHKNLVHLKKFSVYCERCDKSFCGPGYLSEHLARVHGEGEVPNFPCTEEGCTKVFKALVGLRYHKEAAHSKEKTEIVCELCDKVFTHKAFYKNHIKFHKNGSESYSCNVCNKVFSTEPSFSDHMRSHSDEKLLVCEHCEQSFSSKKDLKSHMVVHTDENCCRYCKKKYKHQGPLSEHVRLCHPDIL